MFKNVASQIIGAQMVTAADGTAFTSTVSCSITKDGGTQAAAAGTVTHEGNGFHSLAATQADTNADHLAFTFTGTGAIPVTVQVYTVDKFSSDALTRSAQTMAYGTVGSSSTTTSVVTSAIVMNGGITSIGTNALAGRRIYFTGDTTTAAVRSAGARITANTSGTTPTLTLDAADALPSAPASGDLFAIA